MIRARVNSLYPQRFLPLETWNQGNTCDVQPKRRPSNLDTVGNLSNDVDNNYSKTETNEKKEDPFFDFS